MSKKIISFSLWGSVDKYNVGAVRNAELATVIYPEWECWFYCYADVPGNIMLTLLQQSNCKVIFIDKAGDWRGMFDRFTAIDNPDVDVMISRDCDSRLSLREKVAVDEWLVSDKGFHIMRDHPWHGSQILGGMFGIKKNCLPEFGTLMRAWNQEDRWQTDQDFLNAVIYPRVVNDSMIHAQFFRLEPHAIPFPKSRRDLEFVGQVFDENEVTVAEHQTALFKALKMQGEPIRRENLPECLQ